MGLYKKGILGPFNGKVGTVVGSTWNGIDYMKSLPKPSTKAPTDAQMVQRIKLALAVGFLKPISPVVTKGFKSLAINQTGFNAATSYMVKNSITGTYPDFTIDYSKVLISRGDLTGPWNGGLESAAQGEVTVNWTNNSGSGTAKATDKLVVVLYNAAKSQYVYSMDEADRSAATVNVAVPNDFSGDTVQVWMAFITEDMKTVSTSVYLGPIVVV